MRALLLLLLFSVVMANHQDLDTLIREKESELGRPLRDCDVELLRTQLLQVELKDLPPAQKDSDYKKKLKAASDKVAQLKRKHDFPDNMFLPKKPARSIAQRVQKVIFVLYLRKV